MAERVDFSANASVYDLRHGTLLSPDLARTLLEAGALEKGARVLDIGAGTGRVSIPFAQFGCDMLAVDPAVAMLKSLQSKFAGGRLRPLPPSHATSRFRNRASMPWSSRECCIYWPTGAAHSARLGI
jgi:SAM-dependent methyltransferase